MIKSILRYPGGKSKVAHKIVSLIPPNIKEFREPMVGGGSVALVLKQTLPHVISSPTFRSGGFLLQRG
ncbi:MAG: DNA adenine methylase [Thermocrinis sp.]|uniref:DNA adenine methylase n=1 Tax=Thermocrinis sp. TaxID=2024383 RepID=UPI003C02981F